MEEVQGMRLVHLPVVHQAAHLFCRRRQVFAAHDAIHGLGRGQMVADRTDAAQTLHQHRHLPERTPLDEALEPAELDHVQAGLDDLLILVEQDDDLPVSLHAGDGLDDDSLRNAHRNFLLAFLLSCRPGSVVLDKFVGQREGLPQSAAPPGPAKSFPPRAGTQAGGSPS
jgi:hypothetical protein